MKKCVNNPATPGNLYQDFFDGEYYQHPTLCSKVTNALQIQNYYDFETSNPLRLKQGIHKIWMFVFYTSQFTGKSKFLLYEYPSNSFV